MQFWRGCRIRKRLRQVKRRKKLQISSATGRNTRYESAAAPSVCLRLMALQVQVTENVRRLAGPAALVERATPFSKLAGLAAPMIRRETS